jgi:hypothetical protein
MKKHWTYFLVGLGFATVIWLILPVKNWNNSSTANSQIITDTIYVDRPYMEVVVQKIEVPKKVFVYLTDSVFREGIEKDTLITGLEITPSLAQIHTITPKGLSIIREYPLPKYRELKIDHQGQLRVKRKKHKKFWKRAGQIGLFLSGFIASELTRER